MDTTDPALPPRKLVSWTEILVIVCIIGVIAAIAVPGLMSIQRASNERHASTTLKTFSSAEADFRANDRDWNHVNDFWVADVKSLHTLTSASVRGNKGGTDDPPIRLIELPTAAADGDATFFPAAGENMPLTSFAFPRPSEGYWYFALTVDHTLEGTPEMTYRQNTGGKPDMGAVHNTSKFGFGAVPDGPSSGKFLFWVNENNTIFRQPTNSGVKTGFQLPPGRSAYPREWLEWPSDEVLKSYWSRLE